MPSPYPSLPHVKISAAVPSSSFLNLRIVDNGKKGITKIDPNLNVVDRTACLVLLRGSEVYLMISEWREWQNRPSHGSFPAVGQGCEMTLKLQFLCDVMTKIGNQPFSACKYIFHFFFLFFCFPGEFLSESKHKYCLNWALWPLHPALVSQQ